MDEIKGIRIVSLAGEKEYGIEDSEVREELANVVDGAPEELDSFKEAFEKFKEGSEALAGIAAEVAAVGKAVADETERAQSAEQGIEAKALDASSAEYEATENTVVLKFATIEGAGDEATIPAATAEKAGIMSAGDKKALDNVPNAIEDAVTEESKVTDEKIAKEKTRAETIEQALANDIANAPNLALRALYVAAGAEYNDSGVDKTKTAPWGETVTHKAGHYYLNGLGDITEEEMNKIYSRGHFNDSDKSPLGYAATGRANAIRTNLARTGMWNASINGDYICASNSIIEVLCLHISTNEISTCAVSFQSTNSAFDGATKLYLIDTRALLSSDVWYINAFNKCYALMEVRIRSLKSNLNFKDSSKISKASILFAIQNATATSAITITLHPDAYARLADDAEIVAALEAQPLVSLVSA